MKIAQNTVVTMHYAVKDKEDNLIDSSYDGEPIVFLQGSKFLIEGLEEQLDGHESGETFEVEVEAEKAYGPRHEGLVQRVGKELFQDFNVEIGMQLRAGTDNGDQTVIVVDKDDESVTVDGNHPLAGIDLKFDVEVIEVRAATDEEIAHGHVHAAGGCGHTH